MKTPFFKISLVILMFLFGPLANAQTSVESRNSLVDLHLTADYVNVKSYGTYVTGGLLGEYHYTDKVSAFFPIAVGADYFEIGLGTIFAPLGLWSLGEEDKSLGQWLGMLFALATSIESMGYQINLGEKQQVIPYYSLCRLRAFDSEGELSASLGVMLRLHLSDRWHLNWSAEYAKYYTTRNLSGVEGGISLAYVFR